MFGNKKGEVVTLTLAVVAGVAILVGFLFRPIMDRVIPIFGGQQKTIQSQTISVKPIYVQLPPTEEYPKGQIIAAQQVSEKLTDFKGEEKLTLWGWIKSLSGLWFIALLLGAPGAAGVGIWLKGIASSAAKGLANMKAKHDLLHSQAADIVQSMEAGLASYDATVASYTLLVNNELDINKKINLQAVVTALTSAKAALMATWSGKMDSDSKLLVAQLKQTTAAVQ